MSQLRKFAPLLANHPLVGDICPVCNTSFREGDETTLVPTFPANETEAEKARAGKPYAAVAMPIHWDCRGN